MDNQLLTPQLIQVFLDLEKFITKKSEFEYLKYIRYNNDLKRCEAFDNYGILKIYLIDLNTSNFLFTYDRKTKELIKIEDNIFFPTSLFKFSTEAPIIMDKIKNIKKALDHIKTVKTKTINIKTDDPKITVKKTAIRKILKDIKTDSLSLKLSGNIIIINDRYFIHGRFFN